MYLNNNNSCNAGIYLRLSRDDGDKAESDSIRNQRELILDYVKQNPGITFSEEYADDGFSGTSFERPAFERMMEDVKAKKINCIIVKDLSRLGRNYIETGKYLEKIFPYLGVRFISVTDHYDSADESRSEDQIIIPFKNLINDAYCRDISIKIRSQLEIKRKQGQFTGGFAVYGYMKDPDDKNHLVVDEYAAEIVRMIFGLKMDGYSSLRIATHLNNMNVLPPLEYKRMCGLNFNSGFRSGSDPKWAVTTINRVLENEMYIGNMVQGKKRKINYKVKQCVPVKKEEWIRVENMHEAIIPKAVFENVQNLMTMDTRTAPTENGVYMFSGLLKCADCGQNMSRRSAHKKDKIYYYYHCSTFKKHDGSCTSHNISEKRLYSAVLTAIQKQTDLIEDADNIISLMDGLPHSQFGVKSLRKQVLTLNTEIDRYSNLKSKMYIDLQERVITKEEYDDMNERFSEKINAAKSTIREIENKINNKMMVKNENRAWMEDFKKYGHMQSLERRVLVTLIESIVVYSKDKIEVTYRFQDEIQEFIEVAKEVYKYNKERIEVV